MNEVTSNRGLGARSRGLLKLLLDENLSRRLVPALQSRSRRQLRQLQRGVDPVAPYAQEPSVAEVKLIREQGRRGTIRAYGCLAPVRQQVQPLSDWNRHGG